MKPARQQFISIRKFAIVAFQSNDRCQSSRPAHQLMDSQKSQTQFSVSRTSTSYGSERDRLNSKFKREPLISQRSRYETEHNQWLTTDCSRLLPGILRREIIICEAIVHSFSGISILPGATNYTLPCHKRWLSSWSEIRKILPSNNPSGQNEQSRLATTLVAKCNKYSSKLRLLRIIHNTQMGSAFIATGYTKTNLQYRTYCPTFTIIEYILLTLTPRAIRPLSRSSRFSFPSLTSPITSRRILPGAYRFKSNLLHNPPAKRKQ